METPARILVVDDDREITDLLARFLTKHGLTASTAGDGRAMTRKMELERFDLVVLDVMMPGEDGLAICRRLRATSTVPIILLTALAEETDRIVGLEIGADDYLSKPFNPRELLARIKAVLRRTGTRHGAQKGLRQGSLEVYHFGGWRMDPARRELFDERNVLVPLSGGEFDLLLAFVESPQQILTRDQLLDRTKGRVAQPFDRSIDVALSRLRRKIEPDPADPQVIKTVRSGGYMLTLSVTHG